MAQHDHHGMTTVRSPVFRLERLNLTVPARASHEACIRVLAGMRDLARSTLASVRSVRGKLKRTDDELDLLTIVGRLSLEQPQVDLNRKRFVADVARGVARLI